MATLTKTTLIVNSPAFTHGSSIPEKYTCEGQNINPPLSINKLPKETKSLVLIIEDPDAVKGTFDHWLVWNIPPVEMIRENSVPGTEGKNGAGKNDYTGPCPPTGTHHYYFKIYALDIKLNLDSNADKTIVLQAMKDHVIASGELRGTYKKTH